MKGGVEDDVVVLRRRRAKKIFQRGRKNLLGEGDEEANVPIRQACERGQLAIRISSSKWKGKAVDSSLSGNYFVFRRSGRLLAHRNSIPSLLVL